MADVTTKALSALQGIPFGNLIGGPLNACVEAQAEAAMSTVNFIQSVGLNTTVDENGNEKNDVIYVYFEFIQNGRHVIISVPLLTIVPIPYIAINTIDISFKATVSGVESESKTDEYSRESTTNTSGKRTTGIFKRKTTTFNTAISTKRDSKSTQDSSYSIEATIDVNVHASQDSMPAGMAKVLELLGAAMDLCDPNGELSVSDSALTVEVGKTVELAATYKTPGGLFDPKLITITPTADVRKTEESAYFSLKKGKYTITAGNKTIDVLVTEVAKAATPAT